MVRSVAETPASVEVAVAAGLPVAAPETAGLAVLTAGGHHEPPPILRRAVECWKQACEKELLHCGSCDRCGELSAGDVVV
jgi:hypothetical protein